MSSKDVFEDDSDDFESESGEDFSASEDEWKPGKDDAVSDEDDENVANESGDSVSDDEAGASKNKKSKKSAKGAKKLKVPKLSASSSKRRSAPTSSLRSKLFRRYNPPPKTVPRSPISSKVTDILSNSQYKATKSIMSAPKEKTASARAVFSDSESSDDDGLVNPNELDFSSDFFHVKKATNEQETTAPTFDCNAGVKLSDSSDDDDEANEFTEVTAETEAATHNGTPKKPSIIDQINSKSGNEMHDFSSLQSFAKNLESAKAQMEKLKAKEAIASTSKSTAESDITKLLSMGEGATTSSNLSRKRKHKDGQHSDDSDWENVSDNDEHEPEIKDIQITVGGSTVRQLTGEQKKAIDLEACFKRRLNRDIKQRQVYMHKTSVLCWIAHGNYINRILNNMTLMEMCIKLLPSKNAYPKGDTDVKYYHMVTDWFHTLFQLKCDKLFCPLKKLPSKTRSLALQIQSKKIISKCDFVLLFVTLLRSLGIQCRLVINLAVPPQRPPQKDLFVISTKPKDAEESKLNEEKDDKGKKPVKNGPTLAKKIKVSMEKVKKSNTNKNEKAPESKSKKSKNDASGSKAVDHSYAEKHAFDKVKVKLSRMSESFVTQKTAAPTTKSIGSNHKSLTNPNASSPQLIKAKKTKDDSSSVTTSNSKHSNHPVASTSSHFNGKITKTKKVDNADAQDSPKKNSTKQSSDSSQTHTKTPIKHKLVDRTNDNDVAKAFSPRKTRSKVSKIPDDANDASQKAKQPNKLNIETLNKNVAALLPDAKRAKAVGKTADDPPATSATRNRRGTAKTKLKLPQLDGAHDIDEKKGKAKAKAKPRPKPKQDDSNSDSDFESVPQKIVRPKVAAVKVTKKTVPVKTKKLDNRVFSTDDENDTDTNTIKMNFWVEAYAEKEKKWIAIDPVKKKVDCIDYVRKHASKPIIYVLAWNNDNTIRDVTPRYCSHFHTTTRKLRAEQMWIDEALEQFIEHRNPRTIIEDVEFSKLQMDTPLPTSVSEFKNHPLYALERHLLKFEAIYPQNALTLGYIRNEPVYSRDCVHTLHSREIWVKQARTVKIGEQPYKIVKARPKWNRMLNQMEDAKPLEIFGFWQTEAYKPPVAENGIVPRNAYGNVELFKPEMLPIGTKHIQLPNLNRVCKKLGIDCAQAVVGFDFHSGSSHPTFDGFVVCEEFAEDVIMHWEIEQEEQIRKETEKREARVFGNWKKLIKGLLIRERLKRKFNFGAVDSDEKSHGGKRKK